MVLKSDQQRIKTLLQEAIPLLCKNGLSYQSEFCIEALIGITLDQNDVFLVNIKETVCSANASTTSAYHKEGQADYGGGGDAESVDLSDSVSDSDGNGKIKTAQQYRIASGRTCYKEATCSSRNKARSSISEDKQFERYYNDSDRRSSDRQPVDETDVDNDFADSYSVSTDSPPCKKQKREWDGDTQTHIKQEPDIFEIIDPSETEPDDDDVKDAVAFTIPATSAVDAVSSAEIYSVYSGGLDVLQTPPGVPSTTPGGSKFMGIFGGDMLKPSSSLAQALPELSMPPSHAANQPTGGYGLPSFSSSLSNVQQTGPVRPQPTPGGSRVPLFSSGATWTESFADPSHGGSAEFTCKLCLKCFKCQQNLDDHVNGKHLDSRRFKCRMCGKAFKWRSLLSSHRKKCILAMSSGQTAARQSQAQPSSVPVPVPVSSGPTDNQSELFSALACSQSQLELFATSSGEPDYTLTDSQSRPHQQMTNAISSSVIADASATPVSDIGTQIESRETLL